MQPGLPGSSAAYGSAEADSGAEGRSDGLAGLEVDDLGSWRINAGVTFEEVQLQLTLSPASSDQHHAKRSSLPSSLATCLIVVRSAEYSRLSAAWSTAARGPISRGNAGDSR